jgi:hypothetical protein
MRAAHPRPALLAAAILAGLAATPAAAQLAIPDMPLQAGATVSPNIWFLLDDQHIDARR